MTYDCEPVLWDVNAYPTDDDYAALSDGLRYDMAAETRARDAVADKLRTSLWIEKGGGVSTFWARRTDTPLPHSALAVQRIYLHGCARWRCDTDH